MAHPQQLFFLTAISQLLPGYFANTRVCEVGSLDINGSARSLFKNCTYTGYDVGHGPGVDVVTEGQLIDEKTGAFDVVLSTECFEHNPYWLETFSNMLRMVRADGLLLFTCATTGRPEHGTSRTSPQDSPLTIQRWDYYRNLTSEDFTKSFHLSGWLSTYHFYICPPSSDLYFFGIRRGSTTLDLRRAISSLDTLLFDKIQAQRITSSF
jgi:SAM-dependent methyltransferase